jgi:hypothetical protein
MQVGGFAIGDRVRHVSDPHLRWAGTVVALHVNLMLVRVAWDSSTKQEWVTPEELRAREP